MHALVSEVIGIPTALQFLPLHLLLSVVGIVGLVALGARWPRDSWAAGVKARRRRRAESGVNQLTQKTGAAWQRGHSAGRAPRRLSV